MIYLVFFAISFALFLNVFLHGFRLNFGILLAYNVHVFGAKFFNDIGDVFLLTPQNSLAVSGFSQLFRP